MWYDGWRKKSSGDQREAKSSCDVIYKSAVWNDAEQNDSCMTSGICLALISRSVNFGFGVLSCLYAWCISAPPYLLYLRPLPDNCHKHPLGFKALSIQRMLCLKTQYQKKIPVQASILVPYLCCTLSRGWRIDEPQHYVKDTPLTFRNQ